MNNAERKSKQEIILAALGKCGSIKKACEIARVPRRTFYRWVETNKTFREAFEEANKEANDTIDDEIVRRAIEGIEEPLVSMGRVVYDEELVFDEGGNPVLDKKGYPVTKRGARIMQRKYSDGLLLALAKSRMKKYRDREDLDLLDQISRQVAGGTIPIDTKDMTNEEIATLKKIALDVKKRQESGETVN
jgi:hypothetical protein